MQSSPASTEEPRATSGIRLVAVRHALSQEVFECVAPAGLTLRELIGSDSNAYCVTVGGQPAPSALWDELVPADGAIVTVVPVPQDDGVKQLILTAGLIAAAAFGGPAIAGLKVFGSSALLGGTTGAAFWSGAIYAVGSLAINALIPPPTLEPEKTPRQLQAVTGVRNEFRPFDVVPTMYGRHRVYPSYAALPYTEIVGDDQYFNGLFALGIGSHDVADAKIGETLLTNYQGVEIEKTTSPGWPLIIEQSLNQELDDPAKPGTPTSTATFTTEDDIEEISVDFICPVGLIYVNTKGERRTVSIDFQIEFRAAGSSDPWQHVRTLVAGDGQTWIEMTIGPNTIFGTPGLAPDSYVGPVRASPANATDFRVSGRSRDAMRFGIKWKTGSSGQWDVRVTRTTLWQNLVQFNGTDTELEKYLQAFIWTSLRSHDVDSAAVSTDQGVEFLKLRIKASDTLQGVIDQLNVVATRKLRTWNGSAFTAAAATRNPAWAYLDMLTGPANARPVTDPEDRIWLDELAAWAAACAAADRKFDRVFDQETTVFDALGTCAAAGRAGRSLRDAKHTVIREEQATVPTQLITPRNSSGFSFEHRFVDMPHGLKCRFLSEDEGWQQDEIVVYDDGYDENTATKFETVTFDGKTDPDEVWKFGRYHLAQARLRPALYTWSMDVEHLACIRGDLVHVEHDVVLWNVGRGRITRVWGQNVTLDESFIITSGTSYVLKVRVVRADGDVEVIDYAVTAPAGVAVRTFKASTTLDADIRVGDMAVIGVSGSEDIALKIIRVQPRQGLRAEITAVDAAPEILDADTGDIPDYDPNITAPVRPEDVIPPKPIVIQISSEPNLDVIMPSGERAARMVVAYRLPSFQGTLYDRVQARIRVVQADEEQPWVILPAQGVRGGSTATFDVEPGETYEVQLELLTVYGARSGWSATTQHEVEALTLATPTPDDFTVLPEVGGLTLRLNVTNLDQRAMDRIHVRVGTVNDRDHATTTSYWFPLTNNLENPDRLDWFLPLPGGSKKHYLWARIEDLYGNVGDYFPSSSTAGIEARPKAASVTVFEEHFEGYETEEDFYKHWDVLFGSPTISFPQTGENGGKVMRIEGAATFVHRSLIPYDAEGFTYRFKVQHKRVTADAGREETSIGYLPLKEDGLTSFTSSGGSETTDPASWTAHYRPVILWQADEEYGTDEWRRVFAHLIQRTSTANFTSGFQGQRDLYLPGTAQTKTRYFRPAFEVNDGAGTTSVAVCEVDSLVIDQPFLTPVFAILPDQSFDTDPTYFWRTQGLEGGDPFEFQPTSGEGGGGAAYVHIDGDEGAQLNPNTLLEVTGDTMTVRVRYRIEPGGTVNASSRIRASAAPYRASQAAGRRWIAQSSLDTDQVSGLVSDGSWNTATITLDISGAFVGGDAIAPVITADGIGTNDFDIFISKISVRFS